MEVLLAAFDPVPAGKGASAHILRNHRVLSDAGHRVALLTLGDAPLPGLRHLAVSPPGDTWLARAVAFRDLAAGVMAANAFDLAHVRSPFEGLAVPADLPLVAEINALYSIELPSHYPDLHGHPSFRDRMRAAELLLLDRADRVITPSAVTAAYLQDLGLTGAVLVPNCPSIPVRPRAPRSGPPRLVYLGTLSPWQGMHQALRALGQLTHLDWELHIYTGSRTRWAHKLAAKHGIADRVQFFEPVGPDALAQVLAGCHLGLAPLTPSERNVIQGCMPVKVLDYMRAGLPVLAPDLPVCTDLLGEHPTYRAWSRHSLTELLAALIASDPGPLGEQNRQRVEARFSEAVQRDALLGVYADLAGPRG